MKNVNINGLLKQKSLNNVHTANHTGGIMSKKVLVRDYDNSLIGIGIILWFGFLLTGLIEPLKYALFVDGFYFYFSIFCFICVGAMFLFGGYLILNNLLNPEFQYVNLKVKKQ